MAPKPKFTKQEIIDAAFQIADAEGLGSITIRKVAEKLGSSIAPIYVNFNDVNELIQAVIARIVAISRRMLSEQTSGEPFRDIGLASLRFAKQHSVLFREIAISNNNYLSSYDEEIGGLLVEQMRTDAELAGFSDEELGMILLKMRIFQMGLCIMLASDQLPSLNGQGNAGEPGNLDEQAIRLLDSTAEDIVLAARWRKQGDAPLSDL
ncbi:TetR/AcrR family transcriptional regulator [Paenibacillaceae bacterium]|nr:TetR/AcrR family transcriptional regulator [Paenibacillaceae bacterium]